MVRTLKILALFETQTGITQVGTFPKRINPELIESLKQDLLSLKETSSPLSFGMGTFDINHLLVIAINELDHPLLLAIFIDSFFNLNLSTYFKELIQSLPSLLGTYPDINQLQSLTLFNPSSQENLELLCDFYQAFLANVPLKFSSVTDLETLITTLLQSEHASILHLNNFGFTFNLPSFAEQTQWIKSTYGSRKSNPRCSLFLECARVMTYIIDQSPTITKEEVRAFGQTYLLLLLGKTQGIENLGEKKLKIAVKIIDTQLSPMAAKALADILKDLLYQASQKKSTLVILIGQSLVKLSHKTKFDLEETVRIVNAEYATLLTDTSIPREFSTTLIHSIVQNAKLLSVEETFQVLETLWALIEPYESLHDSYFSTLNESITGFPQTSETYEKLSQLYSAIKMEEKALQARKTMLDLTLQEKDEIPIPIIIETIQWLIQVQPKPSELLVQLLIILFQHYFSKSKPFEEILDLYNHMFQEVTLKAKPLVPFFVRVILKTIKRLKVQEQVSFLYLTEQALEQLSDPALNPILIEVRVALFTLSLATKNNNEANRLIRVIFNTLTVSDPAFEQNVLTLSKTLFLEVIKYANQPLYQELYNRVSLLQKEHNIKISLPILIYECISQLVKDYGVENLYAPFLLNILHALVQEKHTLKQHGIYKDLVQLSLQLTQSNFDPVSYLYYFREFITLEADQGKPLEPLFVEGIKNLLEIRGISQAKELLQEGKETLLDPEEQRKLISDILQFSDEYLNQLFTATELLELRREIARLQTQSQNFEESLETYYQGLIQLYNRGEHDLVRGMALEALKQIAFQSDKGKIQKFLQVLINSYQTTIKTYEKMKSKAVYTDLIKDLRVLMDLFSGTSQYPKIIHLLFMLVETDLKIAKGFNEPGKKLLHLLQVLSLLQEFLYTYTSSENKPDDTLLNTAWPLYREAATLYLQTNGLHELTLPYIMCDLLITSKLYQKFDEFLDEFTYGGLVPRGFLSRSPRSKEELYVVFQVLLNLLDILNQLSKEQVEKYKKHLIAALHHLSDMTKAIPIKAKITQAIALVKTQTFGNFSVRKETLNELHNYLYNELSI